MLIASQHNRAGYTLFEMLAVVAILIILAAVGYPTYQSFSGDTGVKAGVDMVRGRIADARGHAIEEGRSYRLSLSTDGRRILVSADPNDLMAADSQMTGAGAGNSAGFRFEEELPARVTAETQLADGSPAPVEEDNWIRVATFLNDGTCREDFVLVQVTEPGYRPVIIRIRGLTGATIVEPQVRPES